MELAQLHLDTYKIVKLLESKGYSKEQAEGILEALQEVTLSGVATKQDVSAVEKVVSEVKQSLTSLENRILKFLIIHSITIVGVMIALFQVYR